MVDNNDVRGWILTAISGLACVLGAAIICIDLIIRLFPSKRDFKIQDSNGFLSCSLSLSAGVMLFSALYKLLPESTESFQKGGHSSRASAWLLIACFLAGVWGIQLVSRLLHMCMPSHVVDCDHTHDDEPDEPKSRKQSQCTHDERSPLLSRSSDLEAQAHALRTKRDLEPEMLERRPPAPLQMGSFKKPSMPARLTRKMTALVSGERDECDHDGPCKGYSNPCGPECFRNINARGGTRAPLKASKSYTQRPALKHSASTSFMPVAEATSGSKTFGDVHELDPKAPRKLSGSLTASRTYATPTTHTHSHAQASNVSAVVGDSTHSHEDHSGHPHSHDHSHSHSHSHDHDDTSTTGGGQPHHHHVPQNAFLSLSFQTSVAIVLHKLPEGFITYASNHANPDLGFNVFMALAIHNVTEGFCLALPIYLATSSRMRALLYSFVLGGFSQPIGAAIAAAWLAIAERGKGDYAPSEGVYGGLFAATAGILANVALNLLSQSFELSHSKGLCMFFTFVGMGILGVSSALTA